MKTLVLLLFCLPAFATPVHVRSTVKKDGHVTPAHVRTSPDHTQRNNYSAKPNVNPYTGKAGTKTPKK